MKDKNEPTRRGRECLESHLKPDFKDVSAIYRALIDGTFPGHTGIDLTLAVAMLTAALSKERRESTGDIEL